LEEFRANYQAFPWPRLIMAILVGPEDRVQQQEINRAQGCRNRCMGRFSGLFPELYFPGSLEKTAAVPRANRYILPGRIYHLQGAAGRRRDSLSDSNASAVDPPRLSTTVRRSGIERPGLFCHCFGMSDRISINAKICHGQACIVGTRIPVHHP
jgi:hypothetical protein